MALFQNKRSVPNPVPAVSHGSANPMFASSAERFAALRTVVAWTLATVVAGLAIGTWVYGPYFRIVDVEVSGTVLVRPESVKAWVEHDIHRLKWFIIPQDHSVLLSTSALSGRLHKVINQRLSVETVNVVTTDRHKIHITLVERQPILLWVSGEERATIDRHGIIIGPIASNAPVEYPLVEDQTKLPITTDSAILSPDLVNSFTTLSEEGKKIGLTIDRMILPIPRCVITDEQNETTTNTETELQNSNNVENSNLSTNVSLNTNAATNSRAGTTIGTCQNATARFNASDIWLQVAKGPVIYFDRHQDLTQAMQAVRRALEDTKNRTARYIDARFPGRLYVQ